MKREFILSNKIECSIINLLSATIGSPIPEKQMRKRSQNKMSSKKYREKVKNKEKNLLESVDALHDVSDVEQLIIMIFRPISHQHKVSVRGFQRKFSI